VLKFIQRNVQLKIRDRCWASAAAVVSRFLQQVESPFLFPFPPSLSLSLCCLSDGIIILLFFNTIFLNISCNVRLVRIRSDNLRTIWIIVWLRVTSAVAAEENWKFLKRLVNQQHPAFVSAGLKARKRRAYLGAACIFHARKCWSEMTNGGSSLSDSESCVSSFYRYLFKIS